MLGTALGVLLHQRGLFALHASGVATPSGAWLFTGHSGAGKSTLVAWLHRRFGWPILSDDVTVVETANGGAASVSYFASSATADATAGTGSARVDFGTAAGAQRGKVIVRNQFTGACPRPGPKFC